MYILIFFVGLILGIAANYIIDKIIDNINITQFKLTTKIDKLIAPFICCTAFEVLYFRLGFSFVLTKAMVLTVILLVISIIDINYRIIPDFMIGIILAIGIIFCIVFKTSLVDMLLGMMCGGGLLFLLALIPNVMGGGDVKLMFAIGGFLGLNKTLWALMFAFILSSLISIALILFKIKGTKDYIPFGPFLSLGTFISFLVFR